MSRFRLQTGVIPRSEQSFGTPQGRVLQQVGESSLEPVAVAQHPHRARRVGLEPDRATERGGSELLAALARELGEVDDVPAETRRLQPGEGEEVVAERATLSLARRATAAARRTRSA
jgi:hypothetical protein